MVQKPGGYAFLDYTRLGLPITLIGLFLCPFIASRVWPMHAALHNATTS